MDSFKMLAAFSGFSVNSLKEAEEFYTKKLGLSVENNGMGLKLHLPNGGEVFIYEKTNHIPATFTILNFVVENIDQEVDKLVSEGIIFQKYEGMHQDEKGIARGIAAKMGPDIAWFKDPAENILSVLQNK